MTATVDPICVNSQPMVSGRRCLSNLPFSNALTLPETPNAPLG